MLFRIAKGRGRKIQNKELKLCPFCGGEAHNPVNMEWSDNVYKDWVIDCKDCCARVFDNTKELAINTWNGRVK